METRTITVVTYDQADVELSRWTSPQGYAYTSVEDIAANALDLAGSVRADVYAGETTEGALIHTVGRL